MEYIIRTEAHDGYDTWYEYFVSGSSPCSTWSDHIDGACRFPCEEKAQEALDKLSRNCRGEIIPLSPDIQVDDTVWLRVLPGSNEARRFKRTATNDEGWLCKAKVLAIGRKYITVKPDDSNRQLKFHIDSHLQAGDDMDHMMFRTHHAAYHSVRSERLWAEIRSNMAKLRFGPTVPIPYHLSDIENIAKILRIDTD